MSFRANEALSACMASFWRVTFRPAPPRSVAEAVSLARRSQAASGHSLSGGGALLA